MIKTRKLIPLLLTALLLATASAQATLDENEASVDRDMTHFKTATRKRIASGTSHIHELDMSAHTIRQYADANGQIYAISWYGESQPDLSVLLGKHFAEYSAKAKVRALQRGGRGPRRFETSSGMVVQQSGHMRSLRGLAYVPAQLPAGVNPDNLQ